MIKQNSENTELYLSNIWTNYQLFIDRLKYLYFTEKDFPINILKYYQKITDKSNRNINLCQQLIYDYFTNTKFQTIFNYSPYVRSVIKETLTKAINSKESNLRLIKIFNSLILKLMTNKNSEFGWFCELPQLDKLNVVSLENIMDIICNIYDQENIPFELPTSLYSVYDKFGVRIDIGDIIFIPEINGYGEIFEIYDDMISDLNVFSNKNTSLALKICNLRYGNNLTVTTSDTYTTFNLDIIRCKEIYKNIFQIPFLNQIK